jgi:hypothetical protein
MIYVASLSECKTTPALREPDKGIGQSRPCVDNCNGWVKERRQYLAGKKTPDHFCENFYLTMLGNFRTPALINAMLELGADRILFSADYPWPKAGARLLLQPQTKRNSRPGDAVKGAHARPAKSCEQPGHTVNPNRPQELPMYNPPAHREAQHVGVFPQPVSSRTSDRFTRIGRGRNVEHGRRGQSNQQNNAARVELRPIVLTWSTVANESRQAPKSLHCCRLGKIVALQPGHNPQFPGARGLAREAVKRCTTRGHPVMVNRP